MSVAHAQIMETATRPVTPSVNCVAELTCEYSDVVRDEHPTRDPTSRRHQSPLTSVARLRYHSDIVVRNLITKVALDV